MSLQHPTFRVRHGQAMAIPTVARPMAAGAGQQLSYVTPPMDGPPGAGMGRRPAAPVAVVTFAWSMTPGAVLQLGRASLAMGGAPGAGMGRGLAAPVAVVTLALGMTPGTLLRVLSGLGPVGLADEAGRMG